MMDLKHIIVKNIAELRREHSLTQAGLAEALHYSDKAVSKWERGESVPDIVVLKEIADMFEVTVDYLLAEEHTSESEPKRRMRRRFQNRGFITGISIMLVWLVATVAFVLIQLAAPTMQHHWLAFVWAIPVSGIVWLVFNSIWFNVRRNFLIVSLLMWAIVAAIYVTCLILVDNWWALFLMGIPAQVIIGMWSGIRPQKRPKKERSRKNKSNTV